MTYQLRHYRVRAGTMEAFIQAWRDNIVPLRRRFGFTPIGAWVARDKDEFVWIIAYDDEPEGFEAADTAYYSSDERTALTGDADPASFLEDSQTRLMEAVDLPPA